MPDAHVPLAGPLDDDGLARLGEMLGRTFDVEALDRDATGIAVRVRDDVSAEHLRQTLRQLLRVRRYLSGGCIFSCSASGSGPDRDPQPALEARGEVSRIAPGLFAFRGGFLRVRSALDAAVQAMARRCGADELSYPALWPTELLQSINYFHDFPHLALLAAGVEPGHAARAAFAERFARGSSAPMACTPENGLAPARHALAPTVCDCCYWLLRGGQAVANQVATVHGQVFRNERSADDRLDRLTAYTMREIVAVGDEAFVLATRRQLIDEIVLLMAGLDLSCEVKAADDPFFGNDALQKNAYQGLNALKYEVEVPLFAGRRTAVASVNLHEDHFSRSYDYRGAAGGRPFSACVGFGYERLAYALFCRHGLEPGTWPGPVRELLRL